MIETQTVVDIAIVVYVLVGIGYYYDQTYGDKAPRRRGVKTFLDVATIALPVLVCIGLFGLLLEIYWFFFGNRKD